MTEQQIVEVDEFDAERRVVAADRRLVVASPVGGSTWRSALNPFVWLRDLRVARLLRRNRVLAARLHARDQRVEQLEAELEYLAKVVVHHERALEAVLATYGKIVDPKGK